MARHRAETQECPRCDGCGLIADSDDGEAWSAWEALPPASRLAVDLGLVKPIPCPACGGSGWTGPARTPPRRVRPARPDLRDRGYPDLRDAGVS